MIDSSLEIQTGAWKQCYLCRKETWLNQMVGRRVLVHESKGRVSFSIRSVTYLHYELRDVCKPCDRRETEAERTYKKRVLAAIVGVSLAFCGWQYLTVGALVSTVAVTIYGAYQRHSKEKAIVERRQQ